jgi:RHS repeat-associated protein
VDTLLQDNQQLSLISTALQPQRFKKIIYDYDLISGKMNLLSYQDGQPDAFYHFYEYDADNRITAVYTSNYPQANALININTVSNSPLWDNDAKYFYYAHGPLARTEYGDNKVQGQDYAYTLQGWIKGMNSNTLDTLRDIGKDGAIGSVNNIFAKDAFGYTLNYHANDYKAIDGLKWNTATNRFESIIAGSDLNNSRNDLFNGNITSMVTTIEKPMIYTAAANQAPTVMAQGTAYKYDQLNRLKEMKAFANLDFSTNTWKSGSTYAGMYHNAFNYDANGNIQYQQRADSTGTIFDKLSYRYKLDPTGRLFQNRLYHVNDSVTNRALVKDDIDDEGVFTATADTINDINNYRYDEMGNLKHDSQEEIDTITWTVFGKIKKIVRTDTSSKPDLEFNYDGNGKRISKIVKPHGTSVDNGGTDIPTQWASTYYVRDAQGNIMTTYKLAAPAMASSFKVIERNMFGCGRLGTDDSQIELIAALPISNPYTRTLGNKHYEANNRLVNVLTVFTDRKIPVTSNGTTIDHFDADVVNTFDYSPFGAPMNERTYRLAHVFTDSTHTDTIWAFVNGNEPLANIASDSLKYRYGFNGMEKDNEIKGDGNSYDFGERIYDPRLGRFLSVDPLTKKYAALSPYQFASNNPIKFVDLEGLEPFDWGIFFGIKITIGIKDGKFVFQITRKSATATMGSEYGEVKVEGSTGEEGKAVGIGGKKEVQGSEPGAKYEQDFNEGVGKIKPYEEDETPESKGLPPSEQQSEDDSKKNSTVEDAHKWFKKVKDNTPPKGTGTYGKGEATSPFDPKLPSSVPQRKPLFPPLNLPKPVPEQKEMYKLKGEKAGGGDGGVNDLQGEGGTGKVA